MSQQPGSEPPRDPITAMEEGAAQLHELFTAYMEAGFSRLEALHLITAAVTASIRPNGG